MNIDKKLAATLIEESPSFRLHMLKVVFGKDDFESELIKEATLAISNCPDGYYSPKIRAIKAVKDYAQDNIKELIALDADAVVDTQLGTASCCRLAWAKMFVEKHFAL